MSILQVIYFCKMSMESTIASSVKKQKIPTMEQHALKDVSNCSDSNIYSYLETSSGQSSNLYLNVGSFFQRQC
jgi:hypothetical protein